MLLLGDIIAGVTEAIESIIRTHRINEWTKLIIMEVFTFWWSASFTCGASLVAHRPMYEAIGTGLISGTSMAVLVFRRAGDLTKGMIVALPAEEAKQEMDANTQVITKNK